MMRYINFNTLLNKFRVSDNQKASDIYSYQNCLKKSLIFYIEHKLTKNL